MQQTKLGTIRIAPSVLAMVVSLAAQSVRGVEGMSAVQRPSARVLQRTNTGQAPGVTLQVRNGSVYSDVYVIASADTNLKELGQTVQTQVREALNRMLGMPAETINVYIEDVSD